MKPLIFIIIACSLLCGRLIADDKKPEPAKAAPQIALTIPLALSKGATASIILRGKGLADATDVKADANGASVHVKIKSKGKAEAPKPELAEKIGDSQVEIEVEVPADAAGNELKFTVVAPNGASEARSVRMYNSSEVTIEKEPNDGFATAQQIRLLTVVIGSIGKENDVDVYRLTVKAGQTISLEALAARLGSPLDSLLTLYDENRRVIAVNDDQSADTPDSKLVFTAAHDGTYFVGITDAMGNGGAMFPYLLQSTIK